MKRLGYYNGKYGPLEEMMIPMNDRVCWLIDEFHTETGG
jgi:D-alanine transaminase